MDWGSRAVLFRLAGLVLLVQGFQIGSESLYGLGFRNLGF